MSEGSFDLVEQKINDLIQVVEALKNEKAALAAQAERLEGETQELNRKISDMTRERGEVKERVERILARLEAIEL